MIVVKSTQGLQQRIQIEHNSLVADVSVAHGGEGAGPDPHELFDASLGACKAMTLLMYARQRELPLERVTVDVERDDSEERKGLYRLNVTLHLEGALTDAQRQQLLQIADRCPVHKLMTNSTIEVQTQLAEA